MSDAFLDVMKKRTYEFARQNGYDGNGACVNGTDKSKLLRFAVVVPKESYGDFRRDEPVMAVWGKRAVKAGQPNVEGKLKTRGDKIRPASESEIEAFFDQYVGYLSRDFTPHHNPS